ncbi:hypothetical protein CEK28_08380 [Xenophilus sp. AP218F]|nr:hypothetical protein CEK28_08380 [Xenophilus sp. AP218F]
MASISMRNDTGLRNRRTAGLVGVVLFHALLIYALVSGLAQGVVKVIQQKVEVSVISEPPPPPPPPPPPKIEKVVPAAAPPAPKAYVPPVVNPPPQVQSANAIAATTSDPAPQPTPKPAAEAPKGPISAKANCSHRENPEYPSKAQEDEIQGVVRVVFSVGGDGKFSGLTDISFDGGIPPRYRSGFKSAITAALQGYTCQANSQLSQEFGFKLDSGS